MVTVPQDQPGAGPKGIPNNPPYPMSPQPETRRPVVQHATKPIVGSAKTPAPAINPDNDSESDWEKDGMDEDDDDWQLADKPVDVPKGAHKPQESSSKPALPASLRAGPPAGAIVRKSAESLRDGSSTTGPINRDGQSSNQPAVASASAAAVPSLPFTGPVASDPLAPTGYPSSYGPKTVTPNQGQDPFRRPDVSPNRAPLTTGYPPNKTYAPPPVSAQQAAPIVRQTTGEKLFGVESSPHRQNMQPVQVTYGDGGAAGSVELPTMHTPIHEMSSMSIGLKSPESSQPPLIPVESEHDRIDYGRQNPYTSSHWQGVGAQQQDPEASERQRREVEAAIALENVKQAEEMRRAEDEWRQSEVERREREQEEEVRPSQGQQNNIYGTLPDGSPAPPPPAQAPSTSRPRSSMRSTPEHYSIKQIRWYDAQANKTRTSPVLIQNKNGPCPLLALVNALVLSTPESETSGLVESLRTREQVSLELVMEAVFDELTSGRRSETVIPDVGELYEFLKNLHTGMNVNPRFSYLPDRASRDMHPAHRAIDGPGGFEETKEMSLYSTFNIPLVHGWIPARDSPAYQAFYRSAKTYEDAQNIQFHEEELEEKLSTIGLNPQEQQTFEDMHTIKNFLETWPTQLTETGLQTLLDHIKPGTFSILFRNDHFSTIFKEPKANQLLTLVTDSGYASHDEIVWESLVDVNGQGSELFSGDFRPVSHDVQQSGTSSGPSGPRGSSLGGQQQIQSMLDVDSNPNEWSTVQRGRRQPSQQTTASNTEPHQSQPDSEAARAEQADHDFALALQLQEEEENSARRATEARQRENVFEPGSTNTTNIPVTSSPNQNPTLPPRPGRNSVSQQQSNPGRGRRQNRVSSGDMAPPSYEQAASRPVYIPPQGGPPGQNQQQHQQYQYGAPQGGGMGRGLTGYGGPGGGGGAGRGRGDREKCVVM